jgi:tetratricopeptide (TPR) repeat protein
VTSTEASIPAPVRIFSSYSSSDEVALETLERHLNPMVQEGLVQVWDSRKVLPGEDRKVAVATQLDAAQVVVLLVSSDFVADPGCQEEMARALVRVASHATTVVPVLVRSVDWSQLPIGKYKPLPTDRRPIDLWSSADEAWANVAAGLREIVEKRKKTPLPIIGPGARPRRTSWWKRGLVTVPVLLLAGLFGTWRSYRLALAEGDRNLDVGRSADATAAYTRAARLVPFGGEARAGIEKARLWSDRALGVVSFARAVDDLQRRRPADPHVKVLAGRVAFVQQNYEQALALFQAAAHDRPELAEAHLALGSCHEQFGRLDDAASSYERAVQISSITPRYVGNMAWAHAEQGKIDQAIGEFRAIVSDYPLGHVEVAKLLWAKGDVSEARKEQNMALAALSQPAVRDDPENDGRWSFAALTDHGEGFGEIDGLTDKTCYIKLDLSTSLFLDGHRDEARAAMADVSRACGTNLPDLARMVAADLDWARRSPALAGPADDFERSLSSQVQGSSKSAASGK